MAVYKCKMCGGTLEIIHGETVAVCEYCDTKQTVPVADDEKKMNLFARANRLRFSCDFDKAASIYESIIADFPEEAEAYWGLILCKYGIEYVDDPLTAKKIPTCHRSSFESVMDDENFELVMENADSVSRSVYREEAKQIEELRKGIIEVSSKEEPYDIFICYKETAENGDRTIDSVIAQDVYDELTAKGYRVFFSRITLEDKLGQEYEPYIFAALNSAKVMLAFGTDYEYYNAVWVKNEWSRFLQLIAKGEKKTLIPCYKNIDAYDMPKEFAKLQAQDMGKVGAVQDLLRGIEKIIPKNEPVQVKETVVVSQSGGPNVEAMLKRGYNALEDGNFIVARKHFNKVLDIVAECAEAYLGLAMAEEKVNSLKELVYKHKLNKNYQRAKQYADKNLTEKITEIENQANEAEEKQRIFLAEETKRLRPTREKIAPFSKLIASGCYDVLGVKTDGTVVAVGWNNEDICDVSDWTDIMAVSAGGRHIVGLKSDGTVVVAGSKYHGQINVSDWKDIIAIFAGPWHIVGLKSNGSVVAAGDNDKGQCKISYWSDIVAVATGFNHTIGLKADGTVVAAGEKFSNKCNVSDWTDIVAVAAGFSYTIGLKKDGTVVATGSDYAGQCNVSDWTDIVAVATGDKHTIGLKSDGTVVSTGDNSNGQCMVSDWSDIIAVAAGEEKTIGLKKDGTVIVTGRNKDNSIASCKLFDIFKYSDNYEYYVKEKQEIKRRSEKEKRKRIEENTKIRQKFESFSCLIAAEYGRTVGLKSDSTVVATKYIGDERWSNIIAISAGGAHTVGLKSDGTVVATRYTGDKDFYHGECDVSGWTDIVAVSAGDSHTVGLKKDGTVVATKYVEYETFYCGLCDVSGWTDIIAVSAGRYHTVGLKKDGTVVATKYIGDYYFGECDVSRWTAIVAVSAGAHFTVGLKSDGTVVAVGINTAGQSNVSGWTDIVAVSAGLYHTVGLKSDGTVVATKYIGDKNDYCGQCDVSGWTDIIAVSAGASHTVGLKKDGTLVATKYTRNKDFYDGQCNVSDWKLFDNFDNLEEEREYKIKQLSQYRSQGVCQYCGGTFKGLFTKKCSVCGKVKDY